MILFLILSEWDAIAIFFDFIHQLNFWFVKILKIVRNAITITKSPKWKRNNVCFIQPKVQSNTSISNFYLCKEQIYLIPANHWQWVNKIHYRALSFSYDGNNSMCIQKCQLNFSIYLQTKINSSIAVDLEVFYYIKKNTIIFIYLLWLYPEVNQKTGNNYPSVGLGLLLLVTSLIHFLINM